MVKVPKYIHDASNDVPWLPERFQDGSVMAQAYCIHEWYDGCGADAGMQWKGYRNWRTLIFQRGKLGGMGGTGSHGCGEHRRTPENSQEEILHNSQPSTHATILIGYLPVMKLDCYNEATRSVQGYQLFHHCMGMIFRSLIKARVEGVEIVYADGWIQHVYVILAA